MKRILFYILLLLPIMLTAQTRHKKGIRIGKSDNAILIDSTIISGATMVFYNGTTPYSTAASSGVSWGNTIVVAKSGGDYVTITNAINAASAWDVIVVQPGTYNEQVTIDKNLGMNLLPGAVIDYTSENNNYTLNVNSGVTAYVYGGVLRHTATSYGRVLKNAGTLYITSDIESSNENTNYLIDNFVGAELYITNNFIRNSGYSINNRAYLDGKVFIDTKELSFHWHIDSAADVYIEADKIMMDSTRITNGFVEMGSKLSMNIGIARLLLYDGIEVEGYAGSTIRDSSEFVYTGNFNFGISGGTHTKITLHDVWCNEGIPRVDIHNGSDSGNCFVDISNAHLKWIYPDRMPDGLTPPTGQHYFENASDTAYCIFRIDNSYIQWSEPVAMGDTSRELGNIFYFNGGEMYLTNTTFVDYNDDFAGYGNMGVFVSSKMTRIYNCQFIYYGHQNGPMFAMYDRVQGSAVWDLELQNTHFARKRSDYTGSFFGFSWQDRTLDDDDHILFQNCTFEDDSATDITIFSFGDGGGGTIPFDEFLEHSEGNIANQQYIPNARIGNIQMVGPGHFSGNKETFGYRVKMNDWATYKGLSKLDTVNLYIYWKEEIGAAQDGEIPRRNWMDIDLKLLVRDSNLVEAPYYHRYYDIRATCINPGTGVITEVDTVAFSTRDWSVTHPDITWSTEQTDDDQYLKFQIINRDATYVITLDAWLRQSLNVDYIEFEEPYEE